MENKFICISNDNRKFNIIFKIKDEERIIVTAQEENIKEITCEIYKNEFTKDELSNKQEFKISFDSIDEILRHISSSFENGTATLNVDSSGVALSYFLFTHLKVNLKIPLYTPTPSEKIDIFSSYLSQSKSLHFRCQEILNKFTSIFKLIKNRLNISYKKPFIDLQNEIKNSSSDLKNILSFQHNFEQTLTSIKDILTHNQNEQKQFFQDSSNKLHSSLTNLINNEINNIFKQFSQNQSIDINQLTTLITQNSTSLNEIKNSFKQQHNLYKSIQDFSKIKIVHTIEKQHTTQINSICELKDKRLVSCSADCSIKVYNHSYQPQIIIKENYVLVSLCVLKSSELVSTNTKGEIKIWRINEDDYHLIHTLTGHTNEVWKVIEMKDGKISSCSLDGTIKIWEDYECIQTLTGHIKEVNSIIEMNNYIISGSRDNTLRIWDESTYKAIKIFSNVNCFYWNGLSKMNNNTLLVGGQDKLSIVDIQNYELNQIESSKPIYCLNVLKNGLVLIGNSNGEICCYNLSSNEVIFREKFHSNDVLCLIETEDNTLISSSRDHTINIYRKIAKGL